MTLTIKIKMENAAFEEEAGTEAARILRSFASEIEGRDLLPDVDDDRSLMDCNGNKVGTVRLTR